jgi:cation diffusion facilitator CzcD-associated flavoprotein CzcO
MRIRFGAAARRIERAGRGWQLDVGGGPISTAHVVVATGPDAEPVIPAWPGMASFPGPLIHAGQFRNTAEMAGRDVLVVGPGNSGVDLLNHLVRADAGELWLSARSGMNIAPLRLAGIPMHPVSLAGRRLPRRAQDTTLRAVQRLAFGDLASYGYPRSELGAFTRVASDGVTVAVDDGFARALKAGRVTMKLAVEGVDGPTVYFTDGTVCAPDVIICATGYRPALGPLAGHLVALDEHGMPPFTGPSSSPACPGLWFFGLDRSIYGNMHIHRRQARQLAQLITR